ncbi:MAG TPA: glycoside hydrolase family 76 protein [Longimicrobiaceae bacterium]|nr:glycoside hydrolase family 76 protein [Longimicrobiaceae bacterium]
MAESYLDRARAAAQLLTSRWFTEGLVDQWVPNQDYWKAPTIAQELVAHMALAGSTDYRALVDYVRQAGEWYLASCGYLDDATVWGRAHVTTYDWITATGGSGADDYLRDANTVFDGLTPTWDDRCGGGLYWMRPGTGNDAGNFKAMNATLGLMEIGLGLHRITGRADRLEWAQRAWKWIQGSGLIDAEGMVWGGYTPECVRDDRNIPVVALQGNPLTPLWWMYQATGDAALLDLAERIVDGTLRAFVWPGTQTLATPFDGGWAGADADWRLAHQNDAMFKGVFCGFLGPFTANLATVAGREDAAARYAAFLRANADALAANFPGGVFGMDWHTPDPGYAGDPDPGNDAVLQYSGLAALDAAAAVEHLAAGTGTGGPSAAPAASPVPGDTP